MEHVGKYHCGKTPLRGSSYFVATTGSVSMDTVKQYMERTADRRAQEKI